MVVAREPHEPRLELVRVQDVRVVDLARHLDDAAVHLAPRAPRAHELVPQHRLFVGLRQRFVDRPRRLVAVAQRDHFVVLRELLLAWRTRVEHGRDRGRIRFASILISCRFSMLGSLTSPISSMWPCSCCAPFQPKKPTTRTMSATITNPPTIWFRVSCSSHMLSSPYGIAGVTARTGRILLRSFRNTIAIDQRTATLSCRRNAYTVTRGGCG